MDMVSESTYKNRNADEKWTVWFEPLMDDVKADVSVVMCLLLDAHYNLENHFSHGIVTMQIH